MNLHFTAADTMIVSAGDQIACVSLRNCSRRSGGIVVPSQKWSWTWKDNYVSSITRLDADRIVLGSLKGSVAVVDWKTTRRVAFATVAQPSILCSWFSGNGLRHPGVQQMGIHHLRVERESEHGQQPFGDTRVTWVTSCGWAMAATINVQDGKAVKTATVLHTTTPIRCLDHLREFMGMGGKAGWSLPSRELCIASTDKYLCWERVPDVVHIQADYNKFVLNERSREVLKKDPSLHVLDRGTGQKHKLLLGKGSKNVSAVAVHSSHEWILVATEEDGIRFYCSRRKVS